MNILIFTKNNNIKEIYNYIITKVIPEEYSRFNNNEAVILSGDLEIRIKKYNPSARAFRGRIVLYDGDFTQEEIDVILLPILHDIRLNLDGERLNETLLAPIGVLEWLLSTNMIYITYGKSRDGITFISKDLVKTLTKMNDGKYHELVVYAEDSDESVYLGNNMDINDTKLIDSIEIFKDYTTLDWINEN